MQIVEDWAAIRAHFSSTPRSTARAQRTNERPTEPAVAADEEESIAPQTVSLIIPFHYSYDGAQDSRLKL